MFSAIVVGTDGSESSERAVNRALELARMSGARIHVVSVNERLRARVGGDAELLLAEPEPESVVESVAERAVDIEVQTHSPTGDPAVRILEVAEQEGADLIVMGSKGMRGRKRFLLGSVPNKVSHNAPCDVLIVRTD